MTTTTNIIRNTTRRLARDGEIKHNRGMHARVILRNGQVWTGRINGWGKQLLEIIPTDGGQYGWKRESHHNCTIARVELIEG